MLRHVDQKCKLFLKKIELLLQHYIPDSVVKYLIHTKALNCDVRCWTSVAKRAAFLAYAHKTKPQ